MYLNKSMKKYFFAFLIILLCLALISGCAKDQKGLIKLSSSSYPIFNDDLAFDKLEQGIEQSLKYLHKIPSDRTFKFGQDSFNTLHIIRSLELFLNFIKTRPPEKELNKFIKSKYAVYKSSGGKDTQKVLFTGYYEPLLYGSPHQTPEYKYPVYGPPSDLSIVDLSAFSSKLQGHKIIGRVEGKTFVPYHDREDIEKNNALQGKAKELAWVKDPVALFFLQIQGSGKIALTDGSFINVHYHSKNGRPYRSIGKLLIDEQKIPRQLMSMQKIKEYIKDHPEETDQILNHNPSYIFFSIEKQGPLGAINVKLTPGRSIAVDRTIFPLPALGFIQAQKPLTGSDNKNKIIKWIDFSRFILTQDTGGAIKGPARADIFWGNGQYAEIAAGHMKHYGDLYVLVLKTENN
ncbi:Membrane-bound lytic murein transglycosylase A [Desulfonema limicola]|uniref:peptidoglycan lytic exotransglycosylase n=1 Tax=Desulfonema limicola TaxID=45656 RepID=A0A975B599_9BACT|nr:MltA domain-containing protein [Desulfonema limicola]QTA79055.1 Membrane-bound lytic murein transglycosylase A [Desulfonema limicola]